jgi:hemerythrin
VPLFNWNDNYSVKVKEIDNQHQVLVNIINDLHDAMKERKAKYILEKIIIELAKYTEYHFAYEEKLFKQYAYPEEKIHKETHANLVKQVNDMNLKYQQGGIVLSLEIMNFLKEWLSAHILGTDKKYVDHFVGKGLK